MNSRLLIVCLVVAFAVNADSQPCQRIDAAVNWFGSVYFFFGDQFVEVNETGFEVYRGNNTEWGGELPGDIDAAIRWSEFPDYIYYFFKGDEYYKYWGVLDNLDGPWSAGYWWSHWFDGGIDAAGTREDPDSGDEAAYFFKGCNYRYYDSWWSGLSSEKTLPQGLPCYIHAAWQTEDGSGALVLAKDNNIWFWGEEIDGPHLISDYYTFETVDLCPYTP